MEAAWQRWDSIGKPLRSLGALERAVVKMAGMENTVNVKMDKRAIVVLCGDHGVVKEGVTQTDSSVTKIVADNIASGKASINIMAGKAGADVFPVDVGMMGEHYPNKEFQPMVMCDRKVAQGTGDIAVEPAMTQEQCLRAILAGIEVVADLSTQGYEMIGMGEMGIGNTTPSSALVSVLLNLPAEEVTGRGAGLSDASYNKKVAVIADAHTMPEGAANAILKTFEEPPQNTLIIMTARSLESLLPTILSRAYKIVLQKASLHESLNFIKRNCSAEDERAQNCFSVIRL